MRKSLSIIISLMIVAALFNGCSKAPDGVIKEKDMAHVLADFAKAQSFMEQNADMFPDDSSKLLLKQSILKKYGADLEMYDSSLVWYAHNLKIYTEVHDKAIEILEKENNHGKAVHSNTPGNNFNGYDQQTKKRTFPNQGDSANVWKEPQQWILTNAMRNGFIKFDYTPDNDSRKGDKYTLCLKMINSGNSITMLVAIDYNDGCTSYINRTAQANGWTEHVIQGDSSKVIKRIYGFIKYKTRPLGITYIDSTYLLRTHFNPNSYSTISQRLVGPKAIMEAEKEKQEAIQQAGTPPQPSATTYPRQPSSQPQPLPQQRGNTPTNSNSFPGRQVPGSFKPKPGLNKSSTPRRNMIPNPNATHMPRPAEK